MEEQKEKGNLIKVPFCYLPAAFPLILKPILDQLRALLILQISHLFIFEF